MPVNRLGGARDVGSRWRELVDNVRLVLRINRAARWATMGLVGVIAYLLIAQLIHPGFTNYWYYQLFQTSLTIVIVLGLNAMVAEEGGLAWQTHAIVVGATLADTLGTAGHMYQRWGPYDKVVHFSSGAAFAAGIYQVLAFLRLRGVIDWDSAKRGLVSIALSWLVVGIIWETYEYLTDVVFTSGRDHGWGDTIGDLTADFFGAVLAILLIRHHERKQHSELRPRYAYSPPMSGDPELILNPVQGGGIDE